MTDLPYGQGGSPLQNLIVRGHSHTKVSAFRVGEGIDMGRIYCKNDLSLNGSAFEIFERASRIVFTDMIPYIIDTRPVPQPQSGEPICFGRRTPEQSQIPDGADMNKIYDYIRMLDAEEYPKAFVKYANGKIEFSNAKMIKGKVIARAEFKENNGK